MPAARISRDEALVAAVRAEPRLREATSVTIEPAHRADPAVLNIAGIGSTDDVWLVLAEGVRNVSSGPPEATTHVISDRLGVVVDARNAAIIKTFTYQ